MGYLLLWIEYVVFMLSAVALLCVWTGAMRRRWLGATVLVLPLVLLWLSHLALAAGAVFLRYGKRIDVPVVGPVSLAAVALVGSVVVWMMIVRRCRAGTPLGWHRPAGIAAVSLALYVMTFWNLDLAVRDDVNLMRLEAGALALSAAPPRVPDSDNAALIYERVFTQWSDKEDWPEQTSDLQWMPDQADGDTLAAIRRFLAGKRSAIEQLHRAASLDGYYIERQWSSPNLSWVLPSLSDARKAAQLLSLDARIRLADGDARGSLRDVQTMLTLSDHIASEPMLISVLVGVAIEAIALDTLEHALPRASADDLATFELSDVRSLNRQLQRALRMERAFGLSAFSMNDPNMLASLAGNRQPAGPLMMTAFYRVFMLRHDVASAHRIWKLYDQAASLPYHDAQPVWEQGNKELSAGVCGMLTRILMPALGRSHTITTRVAAKYAAARTAAALRRYQLDHGEQPQSLDALVPQYIDAVPRDPCSDEPVRMKQTDDGLVLYSVGTDLVDDGGRPMNPSLRGPERELGDVVFTLPAPRQAKGG